MSTEIKSLNEECGIFGVWGHQDAARVTYFGLHNLQHRGQEGAGIVSNEEGQLHGYRGLGLLSEIFANENLSVMFVMPLLVMVMLIIFNHFYSVFLIAK